MSQPEMSENPPADFAPKKKFQPKALSADDATIKDIKIKSGICKRLAGPAGSTLKIHGFALTPRLVKELGSYKTETGKLQAVVDKLEADGACSHDIKKQVAV